MYKKTTGIALAVAVLFILIFSIQLAGSQLSVGVKKGDWIEYRTYVTGTPFPEHNVSRARIEILDIQGYEITANFTSWLTNGTMQSVTRVLNPEQGEIGSWFLIGANLNTGDTFYDRNAPGDGVFTIQGITEMTYAGATRPISFCPSYFECFKRWDQATGIFVEGFGIYENYSLNTVADKTNMWNPEMVVVDQIQFYVLLTVVVIAVVVAVLSFLLAWRRKK